MSEQEGDVKPRYQKNDYDDDDDSQGFYDAGGNQDEDKDEEVPQAPSKKARKAKQIKKKKKRGEATKKDNEQRRRKQNLMAANETAKKLINQMRRCYQKDVDLYDRKKIANKKLKFSHELQVSLRNVYVCEQFLQNGGLEYFVLWLRKLSDGNDCSLTLKKRVFQILFGLNVTEDHLDRVPQLKKILQRNRRFPNLANICELIMTRWNVRIM